MRQKIQIVPSTFASFDLTQLVCRFEVEDARNKVFFKKLNPSQIERITEEL